MPFYLVSSIWATATIAVLISAIVICYRIEKRSGIGQAKARFPVYASIIPVAFNVGVARDAETQALRRGMNLRLLAILAGLVVFAIFVNFAAPRNG